jgi:hypothetical protein
MADSDPISTVRRPHAAQPAGDAGRQREQRARQRRRRARADDPEADSKAPTSNAEDGADESTETDPRGRRLDVRV